MRMRFHRQALALVVGAGLFLGLHGTAGAVVVLFKDGFTIQGRITQKISTIADPVSRQIFYVPEAGEPFKINDDVRRIIFCPNQVHDLLQDPPGVGSPIALRRFGYPTRGMPLPLFWEVEQTTAWDANWHRKLSLESSKGRFDVDQRVTLLTPVQTAVDASRYDWRAYYKTSELGPEAVLDLVHSYQATKKMSALEKRLQAARFLLQAGWPKLARKELGKVGGTTSQQESAAALAREIDRAEASALAEGVPLAWKAGQYAAAEEKLALFSKANSGALVGDKLTQEVEAVAAQQAAVARRLAEARRLLAGLSRELTGPSAETLSKATATILQELTPDSLPRLDAFLEQARLQERLLDQGQKAKQGPDQALAYALSGWLQGSGAAGEKVEPALALWRLRALVLQYQRTHDSAARKKLLVAVAREKLGADVVARLIRHLPPPEPEAKTDAAPRELTARLLDGGEGADYLLKLPPEYHPARAYPVLIVLHRGTEKPSEMLARWADLAARHGFILAAPSWGRGGGYSYSWVDHAPVLSCLRDLRRRVQVDSDRVFLFGAEDAGLMAYDVGLSHPDLFAGLLVMSAAPYYFPERYWPNAQQLPLYVVDGEKHMPTAPKNQKLFKRWVHKNYPSLFIEYRGRGNDWFAAELPQMMDWMSRKKRAHPLQDLGRDRAEDYQTLRSTDNSFYWLTTDAVMERCVAETPAAANQLTPATLGGRISAGNAIYVRTSGLKQATVWLEPGMVNFAEDVKVRVNNSPAGRPRRVRPDLETLLEDFYQRGDRQRLFLAKIELKW